MAFQITADLRICSTDELRPTGKKCDNPTLMAPCERIPFVCEKRFHAMTSSWSKFHNSLSKPKYWNFYFLNILALWHYSVSHKALPICQDEQINNKESSGFRTSRPLSQSVRLMAVTRYLYYINCLNELVYQLSQKSQNGGCWWPGGYLVPVHL